MGRLRSIETAAPSPNVACDPLRGPLQVIMPHVISAAAYVRATPLEESVPDLTASAQRARLEEHIATMGWQLRQVYEDAGPQARPGNLPGLHAALAAAANLDRLVVVRMDRLAASPQRVVRILARLRDAGCELVCLDQGFDTGTEVGRAVWGVLENLAAANPAGAPARAGGWTAQLIRRHRAHPATVIDVGAGDGTPALYEAFPDAYHVLIEPLHEFESALRTLATERRGEYIATAIGAEQGETVLNVAGNLYVTSALPASEPTAPTTEPRRVPLTTLDALLHERQWSAPYCLKVDVEGYEHAVIAGAAELLSQTELVIAEVSVTKRFEGALSSAELIALMASHGFEVVDVIDAARSSLGVHADLVFRPRAARSR